MRLIDADELYKTLIKDDYLPDDYINVIIVKLAILTTPEVEAIPKEWIEQWQITHEWEYESFFRMVEGVPKYAVECMLDDWEKENE